MDFTYIQNNISNNYGANLHQSQYTGLVNTLLEPVIMVFIIMNAKLGLSPLAHPVGMLICLRNPQINFRENYPKNMTGAVIRIILEYFGFNKVRGQLKANSGAFSVSSKYQYTNNYSYNRFNITIDGVTVTYDIQNI